MKNLSQSSEIDDLGRVIGQRLMRGEVDVGKDHDVGQIRW